MQHRPGGPMRGPPPSGAAPRPPTSAAPAAPSAGPHSVGSVGIASTEAHTSKQPAPVMSREATKAAEITLAQNALDTYSAAESVGRYKLAKLIGKGAYGAVYASSDDWNGGNKVAVKHIINAFVSPTDARRIYREVKVMAHFSHPNILPMLDVVKPRDAASFSHIYLVTDLMETDMHKVIHSRQDLTSDHISYFVYQILCALKHIHTAGVLHRDLKPSNLLVNADCTVKMCDFGLARESEPSMSAAFTEYVVTRWYRAPEVLLSGGKYKTSVDVWSVGCVLAELLLRRPLFPGENYLHQLQLITEVLGSPSEEDLHFVRSDAAKSFMLRLPKYEGVPIAKLFSHVRGPCLDLVQQMLVFDPDKRISVDDALAHPFLARVRSARRALNEEAVPIPRPFKLRIAGGSSGLRTMAVDVIKARFYAELCGMLSPTPTSPPAGELFDIAAIAGTDGLESLPMTAAGAGMDYSATAPPSQTADADEMPKEWGMDGEEAADELGYFEDDEMSSPSSGRSPNRRSIAATSASSPAFGSRSSARTR